MVLRRYLGFNLIIISLSFFVVSCVDNEEYYYGIPVSEIRADTLYHTIYNRSKSALPKDTSDLNYLIYVQNGEGSLSSLILASKYKFRYPTFSCIKDKNWQTIELAIEDAINDYFTETYGENFWIELENEASALDQTYKVNHYDTLIPKIISENYQIDFDKDSVQLGTLKTIVLEDYPFRLKLDSGYNSSYFSYEVHPKHISFRAMKQDYFNKNVKLLPTIRAKVFWDTNRTDFPYSQHPLTTIYLEPK